MNLGSMIKKYRNKMDLTQEQLSEYMHVSVSAVSQWESDKTVPDVSTLLALVNFFDITLDELFDRTSKDKEKAIEEYDRLYIEYANRGEVSKMLSIAREATQKFPRDFHCLNNLCHALFQTLYCGWNPDEIESNAMECIAICERILRDSTDNDIRNSSIQMLVNLYAYKEGAWSNEEKAVEYAMMAGNIYISRENLLERAYFTEESNEKRQHIKHSNILYYLDQLTMSLYYGDYESDKERIDACHAALTLWESVIYDDNYQFYHCRIENIYLLLARVYAKLKKRKETIEALKKAYHYARCYDSLPKEEQHYTSVFVKSATSDASKTSKNYTGTLEKELTEEHGMVASDYAIKCCNLAFPDDSKVVERERIWQISELQKTCRKN